MLSTKTPPASARRLLQKLVSLPTVSRNFSACNKALDFIEEYLSQRGMHVRRFESEGFGSLVATTRPNAKHPKVLLTGHLDVVPPVSDTQFTLTAKDGKLYGRGVMDMKFAIASYLWLADEIQGSLANYDLGIMITCDEEIGGYNGVSYLLNEEGYGCDVAVIPDGGDNWRLEEFAKGIQWVKLESFGEAGHASKPWEGGKNAIPPLLDALEDIRRLMPARPGREDTLLSVGTIQGGEMPNQLAPYASAMLDIRLASHQDYEQLYPHIEAICELHGILPTLEVSDPPCINNPGNPYIERFRHLITETVGREPGSWYGYAAHDGRHFSAHDIPCVIVHPPAGGWHGPEEWLSMEGFAQFCTILARYVRDTANSGAVSEHFGRRDAAAMIQ